MQYSQESPILEPEMLPTVTLRFGAHTSIGVCTQPSPMSTEEGPRTIVIPIREPQHARIVLGMRSTETHWSELAEIDPTCSVLRVP